MFRTVDASAKAITAHQPVARRLHAMPSMLLSSSSSPSKRTQRRPISGQSQGALVVLFLVCFQAVLVGLANCVVVYQVRFISAKTGRTDYALVGESVELSCHYMMKDEAEDIKQLVWSKDGKNFLRWRKHKPGLEVLSYTFKGRVAADSRHSHLTLSNVTLDMHGRYRCSVRTDLGTHEAEAELPVISAPACRLADWRVTSEPGQCRELFRFDCRHMHPKPVSSCGLWNSRLDKFIRSVAVDVSEEPADLISLASEPLQTNNTTDSSDQPPSPKPKSYRIKYVDKFELRLPNGQPNPQLADLLQFAGHLIFKCDILVPDTSWRLSLAHKMFDFHEGCHQDPLEAVERLRANYSAYATQRMQAAGYLADSRQADDIEMLASSLDYQLVAPQAQWTRPQQQHTAAQLDCWGKPRFGSLAKLSCAHKAGEPRPRLLGATTLECQPGGWVPLAPKLEAPRSRNTQRPAANVATRTSRRILLTNPAAELLKSLPDAGPNSPQAPPLDHHSQVGPATAPANNDLDELDHHHDVDAEPQPDSSSMPTSSTTSGSQPPASSIHLSQQIPVARPTGARTGNDIGGGGGSGGGGLLSIPSPDRQPGGPKRENFPHNPHDDEDDDDPGWPQPKYAATPVSGPQLGALLPTCVSTRARLRHNQHHHHQHNHLGPSGTRLPLPDEFDPHGPLPASAPADDKNRHRPSRKGSWLDFSRSAANASRHREPLENQLTWILLVAATTVAATNMSWARFRRRHLQ